MWHIIKGNSKTLSRGFPSEAGAKIELMLNDEYDKVEEFSVVCLNDEPLILNDFGSVYRIDDKGSLLCAPLGKDGLRAGEWGIVEDFYPDITDAINEHFGTAFVVNSTS